MDVPPVRRVVDDVVERALVHGAHGYGVDVRPVCVPEAVRVRVLRLHPLPAAPPSPVPAYWGI